MKQYELIEKYPDSPELGTVIKQTKNGKYYCRKIRKNVFYFYKKETIENNPKHWKKINKNMNVNQTFGKVLCYHGNEILSYQRAHDRFIVSVGDRFELDQHIIVIHKIVIDLNNIVSVGFKNENLNKSTLSYELISNLPKNRLLPYIKEKKVIKKDYEILSFKSAIGIYNKQKNREGYWLVNTCNHLDHLLKNKKTYQIHSVKRLSDGEVFTVGDETNGGIIKSLCIWKCPKDTPNFKDTLQIEVSNDDDYWEINEIQHAKKSITKTDDSWEDKKCLSYNDVMQLSKPYHNGRVKGSKASNLTYKFKKLDLKKAILNK